MKKNLFLLLIIVSLVLVPVFADSTSSVLTVGSIVYPYKEASPQISVGFETGLNAEMGGTSVITGLDLTQDGAFEFVLTTSNEVILSTTQTATIHVQILADGFHLYDSNTDLNSTDAKNILVENAVPIASNNPVIDVPMFTGDDENVTVTGDGNTIAVQFNPGKTKADLVLGTFKVEWKGVNPLPAGVYKAKVSVNYNTP